MTAVSIYLAGPIDGIPQESACDWREAVGSQAPLGVLCFSPAHAYFGASHATAERLHQLNHMAMANCDAVLAYLGGPGRAMGTIREIEAAREMGKPVAVCGISKEESLMTYDLMVCDSLQDAVTAILETVQLLRRDSGPMGLLRALREARDEDDAA
jgi:nucleoside 2-deoxyribosyltransferase